MAFKSHLARIGKKNMYTRNKNKNKQEQKQQQQLYFHVNYLPFHTLVELFS